MSAQAVLEVYDSNGGLVRSIPIVRDARDHTKWLLAESITLGSRHAETAVVRYPDGTSEPLPPSMFASSAPINTIFL